jgi:hypothetical protein
MVQNTYEYRQKIEGAKRYIFADKIMPTTAIPHAHSCTFIFYEAYLLS